jgi:hypothetical protein
VLNIKESLQEISLLLNDTSLSSILFEKWWYVYMSMFKKRLRMYGKSWTWKNCRSSKVFAGGFDCVHGSLRSEECTPFQTEANSSGTTASPRCGG